MTISVGTFEDLQPQPERPIDRNPSIPCGVCNDCYNYQDYWERRYVKNKAWNPATVIWICDSCREQMNDWKETRMKEREHKQLTEWEP